MGVAQASLHRQVADLRVRLHDDHRVVLLPEDVWPGPNGGLCRRCWAANGERIFFPPSKKTNKNYRIGVFFEAEKVQVRGTLKSPICFKNGQIQNPKSKRRLLSLPTVDLGGTSSLFTYLHQPPHPGRSMQLAITSGRFSGQGAKVKHVKGALLT